MGDQTKDLIQLRRYENGILGKMNKVDMLYLNSTINFGILPELVFQIDVYFKVDRLLTGLTAQQKGTTA